MHLPAQLSTKIWPAWLFFMISVGVGVGVVGVVGVVVVVVVVVIVCGAFAFVDKCVVDIAIANYHEPVFIMNIQLYVPSYNFLFPPLLSLKMMRRPCRVVAEEVPAIPCQ